MATSRRSFAEIADGTPQAEADGELQRRDQVGLSASHKRGCYSTLYLGPLQVSDIPRTTDGCPTWASPEEFDEDRSWPHVLFLLVFNDPVRVLAPTESGTW
jgi:hypothetical protein